MRVYLGLGSNVGDRRGHLARAVQALEAAGLTRLRVSPVVETPAVLPGQAPSDWNQPFLNLVVEAEAGGTPAALKRATKAMERQFGAEPESRWAPRALDIDLLLWGKEQHDGDGLRIPHPHMHERAFVLAPLAHLRPGLRLPGGDGRSVLELAHACRPHTPLWMGILNVTPDSFSDGGLHQDWPRIEAQVDRMVEAGVHLVDVGAESTRPGATAIGWEAEWQRLEPVLTRLLAHLARQPLPPRVSVDTRHPETAERALAAGVTLINDVAGLTDPRMVALAAAGDAEWVAMHSLSIPVASDRRLPEDCDAPAEVEQWLETRLAQWDAAGLDPDRVVFDPGIGFGKTSLQSLELLRQTARFSRHGLRVLVGHSRKSFMKAFAGRPPAERDLETIGASLKLCELGADILRVHDVPGHLRAWTAWAHLDA